MAIVRHVRRGLHRVALNTAVSGLRTIVRLGVGFALLPLLLHGIGPARTGLFLFSTTLTGYFIAIDNSVGSSVTRYVAEYRARQEPDKLAATIRGALTLMVGVGLLAAVILAILAATASDWLFGERSLRGLAEPTILVAAVTMIVYWPSQVGDAALTGLERYDLSASIQIATAVVLLVAIAALAEAHASVILLTAVFGLVATSEGVIAAALAWRPLGVDRSWAKGRWLSGEQLRTVFSFSAAAFAIGIAATLLTGFDRAIVGATVGAAAIVGYDLAQRPQSAVQSISGMAGLALISPVARIHATARYERIRQLVLVASLVSIAFAAPLAVLVIVLAHPFVIAWLGTRYGRDAAYIDVFVSFWVVSCATVALSSALYGIGRLGVYARIVIVSALISLPLSIGLALAWGTVGVIWGTVIPSSLALPVFVLHALRQLGIAPARFLREVLVPGFAPLLGWSVVVVICASVLHPSGYAGLVAFSAVALPLAWAALTPSVVPRLRAAGVWRAPQDGILAPEGETTPSFNSSSSTTRT